MDQENLYHKMVNVAWAWIQGVSAVYLLDIAGVWFVNTAGAMASAICVSYTVYKFKQWLHRKESKNNSELSNSSKKNLLQDEDE